MNYRPSFRIQVTAMVALLAFCMAAMSPMSASAQAVPQARSTQSLTTLVQGVVGGGGSFAGVLNITSFQVVNGVLTAVGSLTGQLTDVSGTTTPVTQAVSAPVSALQASCQILNLTLGPLDLNLLGLTVHLNQVVLNIAAQPGPGNLLGNLLCAVANLLNGGSPLSNLLNGLATLLNQILGAL